MCSGLQIPSLGPWEEEPRALSGEGVLPGVGVSDRGREAATEGQPTQGWSYIWTLLA